MVLPLVELGQVNGGTHVWPGTHRVASDEEARAMPSVVVTLPLGGCLLFDVRLLHGGKGNRSDQMRSIVYGAYHRKWFRDWDGFEYQAPIGISRAKLREVPDQYQHLFAWRFDRYGSWWRRSLVERALAYLPAPLERGARRALKSD
jgi:ectoine hydroxylase-related dioxygenase (phytanoyl-CoA dioxygenase family)